MYKRKIQSTIKENLTNNSNKTLIIEGARQIGKSYIIRHEGKSCFKNFIEINMLEDSHGEKLFAEVKSTTDFYLKLSTVAGEKLGNRENTLVFIDEIQAYPELLTLLKFLTDENKFKYIVSGSLLGITLRKTLSIPGGRIQIVDMYQLDFEEFLWANGVGESAIEHLKAQFLSEQSLDESMHNVFLDFLKKYLLVGGLPDAVKAYLETHNIVNVRNIQNEVHRLYKEDASQYDNENSLVIRKIYDLIPSYMENRKKRVFYQDFEGKRWKRSSDYMEEFEYLTNSGIAIEVHAVSNPHFPMLESMQKNLVKLYLNDVGILTNLLYHNNIKPILDDEKCINMGSVYESVVASELKAHGFNPSYYDNKTNGEVDFLIDDYSTLSTVPMEIKSGKDYSTHRALDKFLANPDYNIKKAYVLYNGREVKQAKGITYLPIYYIMFFSPCSNENLIF